MKRRPLLSLLCIIAIMFSFIPPHTSAANEVFVSTNNMILPLTDTMPIKSGGIWYVDYNCLTSGDLKVSSSYNKDSGTLVLYTWDTTLVFNLEDKTAYNTTDNIVHSQSAFASRGTFYIPAQFTASQLGFIYSYIDSVSCIRFKSTSTLNDDMFGYIVKSKIPELIAQYNASKSPETVPPANNSSSPQNPPVSIPDTEVEEVTVQKRVYLTFDIRSGKYNNAILDALKKHRMPATFFLAGSTLLENDASVRRMCIENHSIGITAFSGNSQAFSSPDEMLSQLSATNDLLYEIAHIKSRLVRVPGGSKAYLSNECSNSLIENGYRYWDWTLNANGNYSSPSSTRIANNVINTLKKQNHAVILLSDSQQTVEALPRILKYLSENNCIVSKLTVFDTPTNQKRDIR